MTEPITDPQPTPAVESDLTPETIAARLEKLPFESLRAVLAESERLAANTWQERPDGFENIRGGKIRVYESDRTHKFMLTADRQESFPQLLNWLNTLHGIEFESFAAAKAAVREILDEQKVRIIE